MAPYCDPDDLLLGDVMTGDLDLVKFCNVAETEINAKLGFVYTLPLTVRTESPFNGEALSHEQELIKLIAIKIATGRAVTAVSPPDAPEYAFGRSLLKEGLAELHALGDRTVMLRSYVLLPDPDAIPASRVPGIHNEDDEPLTRGWEEMVMGRPGTRPLGWPFGNPQVRPGSRG